MTEATPIEKFVKQHPEFWPLEPMLKHIASIVSQFGLPLEVRCALREDDPENPAHSCERLPRADIAAAISGTNVAVTVHLSAEVFAAVPNDAASAVEAVAWKTCCTILGGLMNQVCAGMVQARLEELQKQAAPKLTLVDASGKPVSQQAVNAALRGLN